MIRSLMHDIWPALLAAGMLPMPTAAHPSVDEVATTWTGLEYNAQAGGSRLFTLELAPDGAGPMQGAEVRRAGQGQGLGARPGERLAGSWTSRPVARDRKGRQAPPLIETVAAEYFADAGILRVTRRPQQGGGGYDVLVVFDADVRRLAGVYTGGWKDMTPFCAVRGASIGPELVGATGLAQDRLVPEAWGSAPPAAGEDWRTAFAAAIAAGDYAGARSIVEQQGRTTGAAGKADTPPDSRDLDAEFQALAMKSQEAAARGDVAEIKRIQDQMREVRSGAATQRQRSSPPATPPGRPSSDSRCPENIVAWAAQLDTYGGSVAHFEGNNHLSNLFRPRLFTPFFGKPFAALTADDRARIAGEIQRSCLMDGTPFGRGSVIGAMIGAFQDTPGYGVAQAGLAGLALEIISEWNLRSVRDLGAEPDAARVADFELKSTQLAAHLFERERQDSRQQLAAIKSRNHGRRLLAEIDSLSRAAAAGDPDAVERLVLLPRYADAARLTPSDRAPFDERHASAAATAVTSFLTRGREEALSAPPGLDQLFRSKAWLATHGNALQSLRGRPEAEAFHGDFLAARAASYAAERARMAREIAAIGSREALERYPAAFVIYSDAETAPAWKDLDAQRRQRIQEFDRREFLARSGDGPFGPDYPGAIYLNALWRNDQAQLEQLDRRYREPYLAQLGMLEQIDYTPDLMERVTGGAFSADNHRRLRRAYLEEASLANGLLVAFAFACEHVYPGCMDSDPVEFKVYRKQETVVTNVFGGEIGRYPAGTSVIVHRVNHRHAPAVEDLGIADPDDRVPFEALLGPSGSAVSHLRVGTGLSRAMREHACDSEVIRRIETGLLTRWQVFSARKQKIRQRILGSSS